MASRDNYARCFEARRAGLGPDHRETLLAAQNLGDVALELGDLAEAERRYRAVLAAREARHALDEALSIQVEQQGADDRMTLQTRAGLCDLEVRRGHAGPVLADCEQAVKGLTGRGLDPAHVGEAQWALARALAGTATDDTTRARAAGMAAAAAASLSAAEGDHRALLAELQRAFPGAVPPGPP